MRRFLTSDFVIVVVLMSIAAIVRVVNLDTIPLGIHGDEAWTALDALTILREGSIPAYSSSGLGQPSGPAWMTAVIFKLFGSSVYTLRFSMALFGILTVGALYFALRNFYSKFISSIVTLSFGFSLLHIHYSRMGFMLISAPLFVLLTLNFFFRFLKNRSYKMLVASAFFCGIGIYSYNTYLLFPPTIAVALIYLLWKKRLSFLQLGIYGVIFTILSLLLFLQIIDNPQNYFSHHKLVSVFNQHEYKSASSVPEQVSFIISNAGKKLKAYTFGYVPDAADGYGVYHHIDQIILALSLTGIVYTIWKKNKLYLWLLGGFLLQLIPLFTTVDAYYRREITAFAFYYLFAGAGIYALHNLVIKKHALSIQLLLVIGVLLQINYNLFLYHKGFPKDQNTEFVFLPQLYKTLNVAKKIYTKYPESNIHLYSARVSCKYEVVRFLAPSIPCLDMSEEHKNENISLPDSSHVISIYVDKYLRKEENVNMKEASVFIGGKMSGRIEY